MKRWFKQLDHFWFADGSAVVLSLLRIALGTYALIYLCNRHGLLVRLAKTDEALFAPVGVASLLNQPLPPIVAEMILSLTLGLGVLFVLGWGYQFSGPAFGMLLLSVLCYRNSWSMVFHADNLLVLHVLVLGCCRAADRYSVDALVRSIRHRPRDRAVPSQDASPRNGDRYGWPVQLICGVTVSVYFLAGVAKVAGPLGWSWAAGDALRKQLLVDAIRKDLLGGDLSPLAIFLGGQTWLFLLLGLATLLLELGAPLALFNRRVGLIWAAGLLIFHWGIFFGMGITFRYPLTGLAFASFVVRDPRFANVFTRACGKRRGVEHDSVFDHVAITT